MGWLMEMMILAPPLLFMILYVWSRRNPQVPVSVWGTCLWVRCSVHPAAGVVTFPAHVTRRHGARRRVCVRVDCTLLGVTGAVGCCCGGFRCGLGRWPGLPPFHGVYLPWLYLAFSLLLGTNPIPDLMGIAAGHVYYFLQVGCRCVDVVWLMVVSARGHVRLASLSQIVLPEHPQYGYRLLKTPQLLYV